MKKRGQITLFITLGVLLIITLILLISFNKYFSENVLKVEQENILELDKKSQNVLNLVESCIEEVAEKAIITIGFMGGKQKLSTPYFENEFKANYLYYLEEKKYLSLEDIEKNLENIMNKKLLKCLPQDFKKNKVINLNLYQNNFLFKDLKIDSEQISTKVNINEKHVTFDVKWPIMIKLNNVEKKIENFSPVKLKVNLKKIGIFVNEFIDLLDMNPYMIDPLYLLDQNLKIDLALYNEDTYLFLITDENNLISDKPFKFLFAMKIKINGENQ